MPLHLFDGRLTSLTPPRASQRRRTSAGMSENMQVMLDRMPDRPLGEGEARADLADRRVDVDQRLELGSQSRMGHDGASNQAGNQLRPAATA